MVRKIGTTRIIIAFVALACALLPCDALGALVLSPDGLTVYDTVNNISWLANANLPATNTFGIPVCNASGSQPCVNRSGSMNYQAAAAWIQAMNAANYLGHTNWQLPTTSSIDKGCTKNNTAGGGNFGFNCSLNAMGSLYYNALGLKAPDTAVPIPGSSTGSFANFQPFLYWSQSSASAAGYYAFSFNTGYKGANTAPNFLYALPMVPGKVTAAQTVYDPLTNVTWLANANLAATNTFGLPLCTSPATPALCVEKDGAMTWDSAAQFVANMNAANYLGQSSWQLPPMDSCGGYHCGSSQNPMAALYTNQLGLSPGTPAVPTPNVAVGPFNDIQPYLYWSCQGATIQDPCQSAGPSPGFEWSFSFGNGFTGTDLLENDLYVTAYFPGRANQAAGPEIIEVSNAEGDSPVIAPNIWLAVRGVNLAPSGDSRVWTGSDFSGTQMPTQLDQISATVNGRKAYVFYISPTQINILTPPDAMSGAVQVFVTNNGVAGTPFTAQAQPISPSFFVFPDSYVAAVHLNGTLIGPTTLYPGNSTPAKPGEIVVLYANGFGPTSVPLVTGSTAQSGTLTPLPVVEIGGVGAQVQFAGLVVSGEFQFNVVVPTMLTNGDQPIRATYGGVSTQPGILISIQK